MSDLDVIRDGIAACEESARRAEWAATIMPDEESATAYTDFAEKRRQLAVVLKKGLPL